MNWMKCLCKYGRAGRALVFSIMQLTMAKRILEDCNYVKLEDDDYRTMDWRNKFFAEDRILTSSLIIVRWWSYGNISCERNCYKSVYVWQQERHCRQCQIRDQLAAYNPDVSTRSTVRSSFCLSQSCPSMNARSCRSLSGEGRWD